MKLTDAKLRNLTQPGKHFDGGGLYLELTQAGGRYWRLKYRHGGKEKRLALGVYPAISLKAARDLATEARKLLEQGADPGAQRKASKVQASTEAANTFEAVARDWHQHQAGRWEPDTAGRVLASLANDVFPVLGARPMASIKPGEVRSAILAIEKRGAPDQAGRVLQRLTTPRHE